MTGDLRAVLFDFDGTLWDSESAVYGVFRDLYGEHGHELTLPTWSAAIGTLGGFDPYAELGRLRGLPFDVDEVRARTEERIREAADHVPCAQGSPRSSGSSTRRACRGRS
jgi:beta-phosphoglucomutase-like phosphatase (HAD superfamily)